MTLEDSGKTLTTKFPWNARPLQVFSHFRVVVSVVVSAFVVSISGEFCSHICSHTDQSIFEKV